MNNLQAQIRVGLIAILLTASPGALAHHGWSATEGVESKLEGTIKEISFTNPHMHLVLLTNDGEWEVDLAPPFRARRAGFDVGAAEAGDNIVLTGHKSRTDGERYFKAETISVNGTFYDVYPNREKTLQD